MANVSAAMVKELRDQTGAGMMDCKAALSETGGNLEAAVDWLRKKGLSKAAKKAGRVAAEGLIGVAVKSGKGILVEVNSETDFVARNDLFQGLVKMIADAALGTGSNVDKILAAKAGKITIEQAIAESIAKIGEHMSLRRAAELSVSKGAIGSYLHNSVSDGLGRIGVIVAIDPSGLDPEAIEREKTVLGDKARAQGKPANVIDKVVESGLRTFYKEVCLLDQGFIFDDKKSVAQAAKEAEARAGAPIKITGFARFAVGEGIERPAEH